MVWSTSVGGIVVAGRPCWMPPPCEIWRRCCRARHRMGACGPARSSRAGWRTGSVARLLPSVAAGVRATLREMGRDEITRRDLFDRMRRRAGLATVADLVPILATLEEHGWIRQESQPGKDGRGRTSDVILTHPELHPQNVQNDPEPDEAEPDPEKSSADIADAFRGNETCNSSPDPHSADFADISTKGGFQKSSSSSSEDESIFYTPANSPEIRK